MDLAAYRRSETLARQVMPSWRTEQPHTPVVFLQFGFPVKIDSTADLFRLLDTFQEGRFQPYQGEMGGLTEGDVELIVGALEMHCRFVGQTFHTDRVELPLSTVMGMYAAYQKLKGWSHRRVLEIGPGCGYLAYFTSRDLDIERHDQVEVTESLYMLQHLVGDHCFESGFLERAAIDPNAGRNVSIELGSQKRCHHWPWWRISEIEGPYDVIMANACLNEMTEAALQVYVDLIDRTLADQGAVIAQCIGGGGVKTETVIEIFAKRGLIPIFLVDGPQPANTRWTVTQALWVRRRHPFVIEKAVHRPEATPSNQLTRAVYAVRPGDRRIYGASEFAQRVQSRLL